MSCEGQLREAEATIERLRAEVQERDERIAGLEAENKHLLDSLDGAKREAVFTFDKVSMALKVTEPGRETLKFIDESKKRIETAVDEFGELDSITRIGIALAKIRAAAAMIEKATPPALRASEDDDDGRYMYSVKTLTEHRGDTILDRMARLGKKAMKSTEGLMILQEVEGDELHPKQVHRAMNYAAKKVGGKLDKIGGVVRLIVPGTGHDEPTDAAEKPARIARQPEAPRSSGRLGGGFAGLFLEEIVDSMSSPGGGGAPGG